MEDVSEDMIRSLYRQGGGGERVLLVTFESQHLSEPILFCNYPGDLVSNSLTYPYTEFGFKFGGASADQPSREAEIEVGRVGEVAMAIKTAPKNTVLRVQVEIVRPEAPDAVERAFRGLRAKSSDMEGPTISFQLASKSFQDEYVCSKRYLISRIPALFR